MDITEMVYDPVTPVDFIFKIIEDMLEYGDLANCPFTQPQAIAKAYSIRENTGKPLNPEIVYWASRNLGSISSNTFATPILNLQKVENLAFKQLDTAKLILLKIS